MDKKKMALPISIGIASTWFGMHCGSGFATGVQYTIYYNAYGWLALLTPAITWLILGFSMYFIFEYGRRMQIQSYKDYAETVFIKKYGIVFVILFDIWCLLGQILGEAGILSGAGAVFEQIGLNYWLGVLAAGAIVLGSVIFGSKILMRFSTILTAGLVICIMILSIVGLSQNWGNFTQVVSSRAVGEGTTLWQAVKASFTYAGVQISSMFALSGLCKDLGSKKESRTAAVTGTLLNYLMLMALGLVMIANFPAINQEKLPVLSALSALNIPMLTVLYELMLFMALVTTGAGCAFAIVTRYKEFPMKWFGMSEKVSSCLIAVVLMGIGLFGAQFGLTAIFSVGYGYLAKLAWPLGILPALIILPIRLVHMNKKGE